MPILKPQIQAALREAGLGHSDNQDLNSQLDSAGLSLPEVFDTVEGIMKRGDSDAVRMRAAESVLKARGLLKDQQAPPPSITIVINDPLQPSGVNPILLPRELQVN